MKYPILALIFQIVALLLTLLAICLHAYVFHMDHKWYWKIGGEKEHKYFMTIKQRYLADWFTKQYDVYPDFKEYHRPRMFPVTGMFGHFLRFPKSEPSIFLACLVIAALMQIISLVVTCVRKIKFLPKPCRENGCCHLILAIVLIFGCAAEITNRIEIRESYNGYKNYENHPDPNAKIGAKMLASCGSKKKDYEAILGSRLVMERDELNVCQAWYPFIAGIVIAALSVLMSFIIFLILCCFWRKKANVEEADRESIDKECNQESGPDKDTEDDKTDKSPKGRPRGRSPTKRGKKPKKSKSRSSKKSKKKKSKSRSSKKSKKKKSPKKKSKTPKNKSKGPKKSKSKSKSKSSKKKKSKSPKSKKPSKKKSPKKKASPKKKSKSPKNKSKSPKKNKGKSPKKS